MSSEDIKIEFNLIRNAIDSLEKSIDLLAWHDEPNEARRLKQAILSVAHGVELLLKERLRNVHPALIWENVDKYPSLSARTVGVDSAISRLINIGGVNFTNSDVVLIRSLRDKRNAIEHFTWSITRLEATSIVGAALGFAVFFSKNQLGYDFFGYRTKDNDTFSQLIEKSPAFAKAYRERHEEGLSVESEAKAKCGFCNGIGVNLKTGLCGLCGHMDWVERDRSGFDDEPPF